MGSAGLRASQPARDLLSKGKLPVAEPKRRGSQQMQVGVHADGHGHAADELWLRRAYSARPQDSWWPAVRPPKLQRSQNDMHYAYFRPPAGWRVKVNGTSCLRHQRPPDLRLSAAVVRWRRGV